MEQGLISIDQTGGDVEEDTAIMVTTEQANIAEFFEDAQGQTGSPSIPSVPWSSLVDSCFWEVDLFLPELQSRRRHQLELLELNADEDQDHQNNAITTVNVLDVPVINSYYVSAFTWNHLLHATLGTAVRHPVELMATLVRLGHEPLPGTPTTSLLTGRPKLQMPGLFAYLGYIVRIDGLTGLYRGLGYNVLTAVVYNFVYVNVHAALETESRKQLGEIDPDGKENENDDVVALFRNPSKLQRAFLREVTARLVAAFVAAPCQVATIRCMAQFIGGETVYSSLSGTVVDLFRTGGLLGLFAGAVPYALSDLVSIGIRWGVYYGLEQMQTYEEAHRNSSLVRRHLVNKGSGGRMVVLAAANHIALSAASPLRTVATCMALSGCSTLVAASLSGGSGGPNTYRNWLTCLAALIAAGEASRGSGSLLWRSRPMPQPQSLLTRLLKLVRLQ